MIDIFVRTRTNNPIRLSLASAVLDRLARIPGANVSLICAEEFELPRRSFGPMPPWYQVDSHRFHIDSRKRAHQKALSDVYVVIDDDCMPLGKDWLERGLAAMAARPQYAALASWSINGEIDPAKCALPPCDASTWYQGDPGAEADVFEVESLGTPTFLRRSMPLQVPEGSLGQYDGTLSAAYREHGRLGMLRHVRHNHLGYGLSEVVPEWWLA